MVVLRCLTKITLSLLFTTLSLCGASAQCFATLGKLLSIGYGTQTEDMAIKGKQVIPLLAEGLWMGVSA